MDHIVCFTLSLMWGLCFFMRLLKLTHCDSHLATACFPLSLLCHVQKLLPSLLIPHRPMKTVEVWASSKPCCAADYYPVLFKLWSNGVQTR